MTGQFADTRTRQFLHEFDGHRQFVLAEFAGEEFAQFFDGEWRRVRTQRHESLRSFAAIVVRNTDDDDFLDRGMLIDRLLDHLRVDVEPAGNDHVLLAIDQIEIAIAVHVADVAGQKAVADEGFSGFLFAIPVAARDVRTTDADFSGLPDRQNLLRIIQRHHIHFDARQHQPNRARLVRSFRRMTRAR